MFRNLSALNFVFLILVLGSCLSLASSEGDDSEEAATEAPTEEATEAEEEETVTEGSVSLPDDHPDIVECRTPGNDTKEKCCKDGLEIDNALMKCFVLHQKKMPKDDEKNPTVLVKFFSCLIECVYKTKKYIGKGDSLNMKMIKNDAKKQHKDDERQREYMIEMYQHCERHAANEWGGLKKNPAARIIFAGACKPYFMFVFICVMDYGKVSCPHFKWKGTKDNVVHCEQKKAKCEELNA